jgi:hypothetical protein
MIQEIESVPTDAHIRCGGSPVAYGEGFGCSACSNHWMKGADGGTLDDFFEMFLRGVVFVFVKGKLSNV